MWEKGRVQVKYNEDQFYSLAVLKPNIADKRARIADKTSNIADKRARIADKPQISLIKEPKPLIKHRISLIKVLESWWCSLWPDSG
ncbi:hypothetical protein AMS59_11720 [Lysinibacillus sp. FJAT-14745]|nr:hypothetical protein AMS59_11720 [Lysinibacillus sp. FJAT-14745]